MTFACQHTSHHHPRKIRPTQHTNHQRRRDLCVAVIVHRIRTLVDFKMPMLMSLLKRVVPLMVLLSQVDAAFHTTNSGHHVTQQHQQQTQCQTQLSMSSQKSIASDDGPIVSRRSLFEKAGLVSAAGLASILLPSMASAVERPPLDSLLYRILRVREATMQEMRLIKNGTFKDVQRANIKLAVKFMIENYRLNDAFVGASAYLDGNDRRVAAGVTGQAAVQNLYTILEYFDSSDVQNLKVSCALCMHFFIIMCVRRTVDDEHSYPYCIEYMHVPTTRVDRYRLTLSHTHTLIFLISPLLYL
jgi:hypothetical protein